MSARSGIVKSYVQGLKDALTGSGHYVTNIYGNVGNQSKTFDNINDFPYVSVTPGPEARDYQPSMQTLADLTVYIRVYVRNNDDPQAELEEIISDLETFIDTHQKISYNISIPGGSEKTFTTYLSEITRITTDEGLLAPFGMAEVAVTVQYEKTRLM